MNLKDVFGVSNQKIYSYLKRDSVDEIFVESLKEDKHILIYGSSKQGKTSLIREYISNDDMVPISCSMDADTRDIYKSILRQLNVKFETSTTISSNGEVVGEAKAGIKAFIPFWGSAQVEGKVGAKLEEGASTEIKCIEYNLNLAQDVCELLNAVGCNKYIVLDNFHYLSDKVQSKLAYDLRTFHDNGFKFIILGIWREKNHLFQYNGELMDRLIEIPVEPWSTGNFDKVIEKGCSVLKVSFDDTIKNEIKENSFGNIGIVQELCKQVCIIAGYTETQTTPRMIQDINIFNRAIEAKKDAYEIRHIKILNTIAATSVYEEGLFMPYYLVKAIINIPVSDLERGIIKSLLKSKIESIHHRQESLRDSDMTYLLHNLASQQRKSKIAPPIFDYELQSKTLRIIDSTLLFYLNWANLSQVEEELIDPRQGKLSNAEISQTPPPTN